MVSNQDFINAIKQSFKEYLSIGGTSRSTAKLKPLHWFISKDLKQKFWNWYTIKSQWFWDNKEWEIEGEYYSKKVDITVFHNWKIVAWYGVKFVMRNYSQNNINYFENMLWETANIRAKSIPYFQIFIIFDKVPYYENWWKFKKYDKINDYNLSKYVALSNNNPDLFLHIPDKTLIAILTLKEQTENHQYKNSDEYNEYYKSVFNDKNLLTFNTSIKSDFHSSIILNNYTSFITETVHLTKRKEKILNNQNSSSS